MSAILYSALFIISLLSSVSLKLDKISLNSEGRFIDSRGNVKIFHGFNSVFKEVPYYSPNALNTSRFGLFKEWGMSVIRLGVIWTGVQPSEDFTNHTYLDVIEQIIDLADKNDIYVLLDMHQDAISSRYGTYDGIPQWLIDMFDLPREKLRYPWPFKKSPDNEMLNYLTYACAEAAQNIYNNVSGAWKYWGNYWAVVATRFRHKSNILGYELINEPPPGNFYFNPLNLLPAYSGMYNLFPVYEYLVKRIRAVDNQTLIFYEPITYSIYPSINIKFWGTGFPTLPGSNQFPESKLKSVFSYHYYCWILQTADGNVHMPFWKRVICDELLLPRTFRYVFNEVNRLGGGRFLTEFGLCGADGDPNSVNTIECHKILSEADRFLESWTYWDDDFHDMNNQILYTKLKTFSRTYPLTTAGTPIKMTFNEENGDFYYSFRADCVDQVAESAFLAEIFTPRSIHYHNHVTVRAEPDNLMIKIDGNSIFVYRPVKFICSESFIAEIWISK